MVLPSTGAPCPINPIYPMTKTAWMRRDQPEMFAERPNSDRSRTDVFGALTGEVGRSIGRSRHGGSTTSRRAEWEQGACWRTRGSAPKSSARRTAPPITLPCAPLDVAVAAETRLPAKIPVVIGAGDGVLLRRHRSGAARPDELDDWYRGAVRMLNDAPLTDEKGRTWCYNLTETVWVLGAAIKMAASSCAGFATG